MVVAAVNGPEVFSAGEKQAFQDLVTNHFEQEENEALSKWRKGERPVYGNALNLFVLRCVYNDENTMGKNVGWCVRAERFGGSVVTSLAPSIGLLIITGTIGF